MHDLLKKNKFLLQDLVNNTVMCSSCYHVLTNDHLNVGLIKKSDNFTQKGFDDWNYGPGRIYMRTRINLEQKYVTRLYREHGTKNTNNGIIDELSSVARAGKNKNEHFQG